MEEIQTRDGLITNASFTDYLIPTALDMPPVVAVLIEDPEPDAPYGVKGVGEPPTVVSTAAVVSALRDATGRELTRVPVKPGRHRRPHFLSDNAAPAPSSRIPSTRGQCSGICFAPSQPKRSIAAATTKLPVITSPIAEATPIFGAANVIARTMNALRMPPSHSQSRLVDGRAHAVQAAAGDEEHEEPGRTGDEGREAGRLDRSDPVAEPAQRGRLDRPGEAGRDRQRDREGGSAGHPPNLKH